MFFQRGKFDLPNFGIWRKFVFACVCVMGEGVGGGGEEVTLGKGVKT